MANRMAAIPLPWSRTGIPFGCKVLRFRFCTDRPRVVRTFVNISKADDERRIKWALIIERARVAWAWFMGRKEAPGSYSSRSSRLCSCPASSSTRLYLTFRRVCIFLQTTASRIESTMEGQGFYAREFIDLGTRGCSQRCGKCRFWTFH